MIRNLIFLIALITCFEIEKSISKTKPNQREIENLIASDPKEAAFEILDKKCNVCHRKKNPFKIFSTKNMKKHAPKIYKQVFVLKRMPKGEKIKLTVKEYSTLKNWLETENIF